MAKETTTVPPDNAETKTALSVTVDVLAALQNLVSFDEPILDQCKGEAFKLMSKLVRAKSRLAYKAAKK